MAARIRKLQREVEGWRFYVYEIYKDDAVIYVGKGSGRRMYVSANKFGGLPKEVARFKRESDAYLYERERISMYQQLENKCPGGNGSRTKRRCREPNWYYEIKRIGTRVYAARILMRYEGYLDPSKIEQIRHIAYG